MGRAELTSNRVLPCFGQRKEPQPRHGKMLRVIGHQSQVMSQGDGRDGDVGQGDRAALLRPFALQFAGATGYLPSHFVKFETPQKRLGYLGLVGAHTRIHFSHVNRATSKQVALLQQGVEELASPALFVSLIASTMTLVSRRKIAIRRVCGGA